MNALDAKVLQTVDYALMQTKMTTIQKAMLFYHLGNKYRAEAIKEKGKAKEAKHD